MAEDSWMYGCGVGDGRAIIDTDWHRFNRTLLCDSASTEGVIQSIAPFGSSLAPTNPAGNTIRIAAGHALVYGIFYTNTADVDFDVTGPGGGLQTDLIVLRHDVVANTVRLVHKQGIPGGAAAVVVQDPATYWEIALVEIVKNAGTNISTWTDKRVFCHFATMIAEQNIDDLAVTTAKIANTSVTTGKIANNAVDDTKIRDSAALSVIGRSSNSVGDPADIAAGTDNYILRRSGTTIGFGQIVGAGIADGTIDSDKIGNLIPKIVGRVGGSANDWNTAGSTEYTPGVVRCCMGVASVTISAGNGNGNAAVAFITGSYFDYKPIVICSIINVGGGVIYSASADSVSSTGFTANLTRTDGGVQGVDVTIDIAWIAFGPPDV